VTSPFGPLVLIANPRAGRGKVEAALPRVERVLRDEGLDYRIVRTTHPGHATEAARHALRNGERFVVAAGGDGTVHEVVNGMIQNGTPIAPDAVLGVVAAGSGCDFVRTFGLPGDAGAAARRLAGDRLRVIDAGTVTCTDSETNPTTPTIRTRYFVNIAEAGLGGAVVARTARLGRPGRFLGAARYASGFWLTLPGFRPAPIRLDADGQASSWRAFNVVVANCSFYGGGMQISPKSDPGDGLLDVLVMTGPKSDAFSTLPKVYRGTHLPHRNIAELRAGRIRLDADRPFPVEADGEIVGTTPVSFGIIPGVIRLKV
jgi:diacylglycerol kinase (ATP)